jgi:hypothetical protein
MTLFDSSLLDLFSLDNVETFVSILSSIAIILGAVFVVFQLKQDDKLKQANSAADQATLSSKQLVQNNNLATMDLVMRIYEFADGTEFQSSWLTVLRTQIASFEDYQKLPDKVQLAYYQVASLFESLGLLVERGFVDPGIIDDMFATQLAWDMLKPFIMGVRERYASEDYFFFFERLKKRLADIGAGSITGAHLAAKAGAPDATKVRP